MFCANFRLAMKGIFWQSEAESCATKKPSSIWRLRKYQEKEVVRCFPLCTHISQHHCFQNQGTTSEFVLASSADIIRGNLSRVCLTRKYYLRSNMHLHLFMSFGQQTTLFKATKETIEKSLRCILILNPILLILFESLKYLP